MDGETVGTRPSDGLPESHGAETVRQELAALFAPDESPPSEGFADRWGQEPFGMEPTSERLDGPTQAADPNFEWSTTFASEDQRERSASGDLIPLQFSFSGSMALADAIELNLEGGSFEAANRKTQTIGGLLLNQTDEWRRGELRDIRLAIGLLDDRIRYGTRQAQSSYSDFSKTQVESGAAAIQRLEADLLTNEAFGLTTFATFGRTSLEFRNPRGIIKDKDRRKKIRERKAEGNFVEAGSRSGQIGAKLRAGPTSLAIGRVGEKAVAGSDAGKTKSSYTAKATVHSGKLLDDAGGGLASRVKAVRPDWLWVEYRHATIVPRSKIAKDRAATRSVGGTWRRGTANASVSYWSSERDDREPSSDGYDWNGSGLNVELGRYGKRWSAYGSLRSTIGLNSGDGDGSDASSSGAFWVTLQPASLPEVKTSFETYRQRSEYREGANGTRDWSLTTEIDLSRPQKSGIEASIKLLFRVDRGVSAKVWNGDRSTDRALDLFGGFQVEIAP